eukprot:g46445.t1
MCDAVDRQCIPEAGVESVGAVEEDLGPSVLPPRVQAGELGQPAGLVEDSRFLVLPLRPGRVLRLGLRVQRVQRVRVVHMGIGVLRLRVDGLVRRREVGWLEVRVGSVRERRGGR